MARKLILIGIVLVGFLLALGSNAWADRGRHGKRHHDDKGYRYCHKTHHGHHYGWHKGKWNPHRDRYHHRREYRHRDRHHRWDRDRYRGQHYRDRHHRDRYYKGRHHHKRVVEKHVYHHGPKRHRHVEKHVYHHYPKRHDRSSIAFTVIDQVLGVAVAVSGTH